MPVTLGSVSARVKVLTWFPFPSTTLSVRIQRLPYTQLKRTIVTQAEVLNRIFHVAFVFFEIHLKAALSTDTDGPTLAITRVQFKF